MANKQNLAVGIVATAPTPATSGTTIVLQSGHGATFPSAPFYATLTPPNQISSSLNSEIVLVTTVSTDTLTVVRAQKGTTAKSIAVDWIIGNGVYVDEVDPAVNGYWNEDLTTWTYNAWTSGTRYGVINVVDSTKYKLGDRITINQTTGGDKYGIVTALPSSTTIGVFFKNGNTLNNEAINSHKYSSVYAPSSFSLDPYDWSLSQVSSYSSVNNPTNTTVYQLGSPLAICPGAWNVIYKRHLTVVSSTIDSSGWSGIGTSATSGTIDDFVSHIFTNNASNLQIGLCDVFPYKTTSAVSLYPQACRTGGVNGLIAHEEKKYAAKITATSTYI